MKLQQPNMRVRIAHDVLAQLNHLICRDRVYMHFPVRADYNIRDQPLCDVLAATSECSVCALGAMMVGLARLDKGLRAGRFLDVTSTDANILAIRMRAELAKYFSCEQLVLIESAFELYSRTHASHKLVRVCPDRVAAAIAFGRLFARPHDRVAAIMQNIIDNRGEFKPPQHHAYKGG